jgi:hypothetical protein
MTSGGARPMQSPWFGKTPAKKPCKVNVFEHVMTHQGILEQAPMFPFFGPGDIVPTTAFALSSPDTPRLHFYHYNDVPEVILAMAGEGGLISAGQLYLQEGTHGVTTFLRKPTAPEGQSYIVAYIIMRMKDEAPQNEGFILRCHKCNEIVFRMDRDVWAGRPQPYYPELPNLRFYAEAADAYNAEPRTCGKCSTAQARFPTELVGWRRYIHVVDVANRARHNLEAAATAAAAAR